MAKRYIGKFVCKCKLCGEEFWDDDSNLNAETKEKFREMVGSHIELNSTGGILSDMFGSQVVKSKAWLAHECKDEWYGKVGIIEVVGATMKEEEVED